MSIRLSDFLESTQVSIHTCCTLFLLKNTLLVSLLSVFIGILFCKAEEPGPLPLTIGLVARIWCSHLCDLTSISGQGTKAQLQATAGQGHWKSFSPRIGTHSKRGRNDLESRWQGLKDTEIELGLDCRAYTWGCPWAPSCPNAFPFGGVGPNPCSRIGRDYISISEEGGK